jgi:PAS domain S-box-containing protein
LSEPEDTPLILAAWDMALTQRQPPPGLEFHSDRGVQYASHDRQPNRWIQSHGAAGPLKFIHKKLTSPTCEIGLCLLLVKPPPKPADEARRLAALRECHWLDTQPEPAFDELTVLVAHLCEAPIALITLVDENRQWFKSKFGLDVSETPRDISFCGHAILQTDLFLVPDAFKDERFADNPLVTGRPNIRFYAGAPLVTVEGHVLGTLSVIDFVPRQLTPPQKELLRGLSRQVMAQLELRRQTSELRRQTQELAASRTLLQEREEQLRLYVQHSPAGVAMFDRDMKYLVASRRWLEDYRLGDQDIIGRSHYEVFPEIPPRWKEIHQRCQAGAVEKCDEDSFLRADGRRDWLRWEVRPWHQADGGIGGIIVFSEDITARKLAEAALRASQADYGTLFQFASDGIVILDAQNRNVDANAAACRMLGYPREELLTLTSADIVTSSEVDRLAQELARLRVGEVMRSEWPCRRKTGIVFTCDVSATLLSDGRLLAIGRDVTERNRSEEALRASEQQLRKVIDGLGPNNFVGLLALDGTVIEANEPALAAAGLRLEEVRGLPVDQTYWFTYSAAVQEQLRAAVAKAVAGEPSRYDVQVRVAKDVLIWLDFSIRPVRDASGQITHLVPSANVIEERKRAELRIQKLHRTLAVLSDINQTIVREKEPAVMLQAACQIAVERGKFRMAWVGVLKPETQTLQAIASSGVVEGYLDGVKIDLLDETRCTGPAARCLRSGEHAICNDIAHDPIYLPWREEALRRGYQSSGGFPIKVAGQVVGVFSLYADEPGFFNEEELRLLDELAMDISFALEVSQREQKRQKAEAELLWRTAFFEAQAESTMDGVLVVDGNGKIILQNARMKELWKIPPNIAGNDDDAVQLQYVTQQVKNSQQFAEKVAFLNSHPNEIGRDEIELIEGTILDRSSSPVRDKAGNYYGRIWTFRDITQQRQLEGQLRQSQKMEAIGQLAGGVAHDFNNILGAIIMQVDIARSEVNLSAEMRSSLGEIRAAAERAANLTRQLLAFSRRQVMQLQSVDLNGIVTSLTNMLQRILGEDVRLQLNLHSGALLTRADSGMLGQVLLNLVVNARDAMPDGGQLTIDTDTKVCTEAEAAARPDIVPGRYVGLRVTDTGCGMTPEIQARIFEPFFTTKEAGKGTGLGLATVFGIVKQHGGWISVDSQVGRGATFHIFLPAEVKAVKDSAPASVSDQPCGGTETILLVEDDLSVRRLIRVVLTRAGYRVLEAANGVEALELWNNHPETIQLLFTDLVMPEGVNGRSLASELQTRNPKLRVVFTSGYSPDIAGRELVLQDGQEFLQKPSSPGQILAIVRRCLDV